MKDKQNGFILAELLVSLLLASMVLGAAMPLFSTLMRQYTYITVSEELREQARYTAETLTFNLQYARYIEISSDSNRINFVTEDGQHSGYMLMSGTIYRLLQQGSSQPITGNGNNENNIANTILAKKMDNDKVPFILSEGNGCYRIRFTLIHTKTGKTFDTDIRIIPVTATWEGRKFI